MKPCCDFFVDQDMIHKALAKADGCELMEKPDVEMLHR